MRLFRSIPMLILTALFFLGCSKSNDETIGCTFQITPVFLEFNVVDATNKDLFFSNVPDYQIEDIYFFKVQDVAKKDTIRPTVKGTGAERVFRISPNNKLSSDTLMMHIGKTSLDKMVVKIKNSDDLCSNWIISEVWFNDVKLDYVQNKIRILK